MSSLPAAGEGWRHHEGELYQIVGTGYDDESGDSLVIYRHYPTRGDSGSTTSLWVRPLSKFLGFSEAGKIRFRLERFSSNSGES